MHIIEQGRVFVQKLHELAQRSGVGLAALPMVWGDVDDQVRGRQQVRIRRHECHGCGAFYDKEYAFLVLGSW